MRTMSRALAHSLIAIPQVPDFTLRAQNVFRIKEIVISLLDDHETGRRFSTSDNVVPDG